MEILLNGTSPGTTLNLLRREDGMTHMGAGSEGRPSGKGADLGDWRYGCAEILTCG